MNWLLVLFLVPLVGAAVVMALPKANATLAKQVGLAFSLLVFAITIVAAPQRDGGILMFEKTFESRMFFVDKLISMGARIVLCDPHRAIVAGPSRLRGAPMTSPDIRAGMAMLLAAVAAEGTSTINNADQIERGYERIEERLNALGARITRVPERDSH